MNQRTLTCDHDGAVTVDLHVPAGDVDVIVEDRPRAEITLTGPGELDRITTSNERGRWTVQVPADAAGGLTVINSGRGHTRITGTAGGMVVQTGGATTIIHGAIGNIVAGDVIDGDLIQGRSVNSIGGQGLGREPAQHLRRHPRAHRGRPRTRQVRLRRRRHRLTAPTSFESPPYSTPLGTVHGYPPRPSPAAHLHREGALISMPNHPTTRPAGPPAPSPRVWTFLPAPVLAHRAATTPSTWVCEDCGAPNARTSFVCWNCGS